MVDIAARSTQQTKKSGEVGGGKCIFDLFKAPSFLEEEGGTGTQKSWEAKHQRF